jgi:hypothetical protein
MRPVTDENDAGLRDLLIALVDLVEGRARFTPSEALEIVGLATEEGQGGTLDYALLDCANCRHIVKGN